MSKTQQLPAASVGLADKRSSTPLKNYLDETKPCPPIGQMIANMALQAKTNGKLLLISEIRYAIAGIPTMINDDYIYWPPGTVIEIGSTGKLGQAPEEYEENPGPKLLSMHSFCFAEEILPPDGKKSKKS